MYYLDMISNMNKYLVFNDLDTFDIYCEYLLNDKSKAVNYTNLLNLYDLINKMDDAAYINQDAKMARFLFVKYYLEAKVNLGVSKRKLCIQHVFNTVDKRYHLIIRREIIDAISQDEMDKKSIEFINGIIFANLNYIFMHKYKPALISLVEDIENNKIIERKDDLIPLFQSILSELTTAKRRSIQNNSFSLSDELLYRMLIKESVDRLSAENNFLLTGWHGMNILLNGGIENGRVYNFVGGTGGFKSGMLLNLLKSVKKYNKGRIKRSPNKRTTILFISQENNIWETIQRIFNIFATVKHIKNYTYSEVLEMLKEGGFSIVNDEDDIDIEFRYYGNEDIGVGDIKGIVEELENGGKEVCIIIQDYVERLKPPSRKVERRIQLFDITNEMHDLAVELDIPIITASQLNRSGVSVIEQLTQDEDYDKAGSIGQKDISESFGMLKNIDVNIIIIPIYVKSEDKFYLFVKKLKFRGADESPIDSFYQPFEGENSKIMLMDDIMYEKPLFKMSLNTDNYDGARSTNVVDTSNKTGKNSVVKRKSINNLKSEDDSDMTEIDALIDSFKSKPSKPALRTYQFTDKGLIRRNMAKLLVNK